MRALPQNLRSRASRGVALVIVLWVVTLLSLIASSFIYAMRSEVGIVANGTSRVRAAVAADAGVQRAIYELFKPVNTADRWNNDGVAHDWTFGDATVSVTMQDESGKIDINTANEQLMQSFLRLLGVAPDDAVALSDAIADWRDADNLKRLHGAEEAEYTAAGLTYKPANAPFLALEELKLVLGMTQGLYDKMAPHITIYSRLPGVNAQIASRTVLLAIPNVTAEQVDAYIQQRDLARANHQPIPVFTAGAAYTSIGSGFINRIRATAHLPDGNSFIREVVAMRQGNPKRPYAFLMWREGREIDENDPNAAGAGVPNTAPAQVR